MQSKYIHHLWANIYLGPTYIGLERFFKNPNGSIKVSQQKIDKTMTMKIRFDQFILVSKTQQLKKKSGRRRHSFCIKNNKSQNYFMGQQSQITNKRGVNLNK